MGIAGIKIKIMPESPESNLEEITKKAKAIVVEKGGKNRGYEEEPIAFGLNAIIAFFELSEDKEPSEIEEALKTIDGVSSTQVIDMRRLI
jgi:elongation factor 1-beta